MQLNPNHNIYITEFAIPFISVYTVWYFMRPGPPCEEDKNVQTGFIRWSSVCPDKKKSGGGGAKENISVTIVKWNFSKT
jgi:hypothetical protein